MENNEEAMCKVALCILFLNTLEYFQKFLIDLESTIVEKNEVCNRKTISSILSKILACDIESCYRNISNKIFNVSYILQK